LQVLLLILGIFLCCCSSLRDDTESRLTEWSSIEAVLRQHVSRGSSDVTPLPPELPSPLRPTHLQANTQFSAALMPRPNV